jgi:hypothetical protein
MLSNLEKNPAYSQGSSGSVLLKDGILTTHMLFCFCMPWDRFFKIIYHAETKQPRNQSVRLPD